MNCEIENKFWCNHIVSSHVQSSFAEEIKINVWALDGLPLLMDKNSLSIITCQHWFFFRHGVIQNELITTNEYHSLIGATL